MRMRGTRGAEGSWLDQNRRISMTQGPESGARNRGPKIGPETGARTGNRRNDCANSSGWKPLAAFIIPGGALAQRGGHKQAPNRTWVLQPRWRSAPSRALARCSNIGLPSAGRARPADVNRRCLQSHRKVRAKTIGMSCARAPGASSPVLLPQGRMSHEQTAKGDQSTPPLRLACVDALVHQTGTQRKGMHASVLRSGEPRLGRTRIAPPP